MMSRSWSASRWGFVASVCLAPAELTGCHRAYLAAGVACLVGAAICVLDRHRKDRRKDARTARTAAIAKGEQ